MSNPYFANLTRRFLKLKTKTCRKDATPFVKRSVDLTNRLYNKPLLWDSTVNGTYIKARDGELL